MLLGRYQIFIWLYIPLVAHSQNETETNVVVVEITTEPISQDGIEYDISTQPSNNHKDKYARCIRTYANTCKEIDSVDENIKDGQSSFCMCDENCSIYDDCCSDAEYQNKNELNFVCIETSFDGNIYIKNTCQFTNNNTLWNFCINQSIDKKTVFSMIPVTSMSTNITYANFFCALCNNDTNFSFWDVVVIPKFQSNITHLDVNEISLHDEYFFHNSDEILETNYTIHTKIPSKRLSPIRYCMPDKIKNCLQNNAAGMELDCLNVSFNNLDKNESSFSQCFSNNTDTRNISTIKAKNILFRFCEIIPADNSAFKMFCQKNTLQESIDESLIYIENCFLKTKDNELCLINSIFLPDEFQIIDNETIYIYQYKSNFSHKQWTSAVRGHNSSVFVCGTEIPRSPKDIFFRKLNELLSEVLSSISVCFLVLYIITYSSVKKLRYPFNTIILCYSVTLLIAFVLLLITNLVSSCKVIAAFSHYFLLSCFTWLVVASFECWRTVTASTNSRNKNQNTWTRFGIYCLVGWVLPISIMSVAIYFELSSVKSVPCHLKPGYGRLNQCFIAQTLPKNYLFFYPSWIMFLINIYFFVHISLYVFCYSSLHRNFSIFAKLALVTGLPWTIGILIAFTKLHTLQLIYVILNSSQGIFIYFVFGYDKKIVTNAFKKMNDCFKNSKKQNNGRAMFTATTDIHDSYVTTKEDFF